MKSKIALGTAQFGLDYGINNRKGKISKNEVFKILEVACHSGIDLLDTAFLYGESQKYIGQFIKTNKANFKIVSKFPNDCTKDLESSLDISLKTLNLESLYGYLFHDFKMFLDNPEILDVLVRLKKIGKIRKFGFSLYYPQELNYLLERKIPLDIVQLPFSIFDQRFSRELLMLKRRNIEIHARSVLLQGLIFKIPSDLKGNFLKIGGKLLNLRILSEKKRIPLSAIAINFVALNKFIDKVIIGVDCLVHLKENIGAKAFCRKVQNIYTSLLALKEDDEGLILPINWKKGEAAGNVRI